MKYIVLVPDGVADEPVSALGGRTPLEAARTPHMDEMARHGFSALVQTIPDGMAPGSDVGNLALMGYDPRGVLTGRAALEAANLGIELKDSDMAFRCNLVTVMDDKMLDYSAGHITHHEAAQIMKDLAVAFNDPYVTYYTGKSYRHIALFTSSEMSGLEALVCTPPHDILGQAVAEFLPRGTARGKLMEHMEQTRAFLDAHPVNAARVQAGKLPANRIWFWGQGRRPSLVSYREKFGLSGSMISAVDLVNGIGRLAGLHVIAVPGVTGYLDTNFRGKADYALASLEQNDFVFVHVEATDEAGHNGDPAAKVEAVERFDADVAGPVLAWAKLRDDVRILVSPDHATPLARRTHTRAPVPFLMYGKGIEPNGMDGYNESSAARAGLRFASGKEMVQFFIGKKGV
ncbi:MAG: cofactor-independent phosphoglycerate mutase [Candidatus Omnitrophota bacterium]